ncbi:MAG TPA: FAD-dependent oxidoreductase [Gammaproteobacteria bacterium]|nr:FAD-dependent oxidoreductase [Gammaproteobacteria bacterium]
MINSPHPTLSLKPKTILRILVALAIIALIACFFVFDLGRYFNLAYLQAERQRLGAAVAANPWETAAIFFGIYVLVTALSLPGAALMTLAGGAIFGFAVGVVLVSFASSIGATCAFLIARFLFRDAVQRRFGDKLRMINRGVEKDGAFYLFTLRLVPLFPFFIINIVMALTPIRTLTFYAVSQIGMLAGTLVYVNAGTQLGQLHSLSGILSLNVIGSFVLLGIFPLVTKKALDVFRARRIYRPYAKPRRFDRNLIVIGAGSAGLIAAYVAATVKAKVTLIEKNRMGGDCLNTGCVPSKALICSAQFLHDSRRATTLGFHTATVDFDFADVMARVQRVIATVAPHDSAERYTELGVECIAGEAHIESPWQVTVNGGTLTTRAIVLATGARPAIPTIDGLDAVDYLTTENIWNLRELPNPLLVLGGGPVGCELAQCFARFGSRVTLIEMGPRLLPNEDADASDIIHAQFQSEGIDIRTGHRARAVRDSGGEKRLICDHNDAENALPFDALLIAVGRKANLAGYGLEQLGIPATALGTIEVNEYLQTRFPNIYACGDAIAPYQFTHVAGHEAWYAGVNALFGGLKKFKADYSVVPWCTFSDPEVARVGLNETEAQRRGIDYELSVFELAELDRAIVDDAAQGFVKVLTTPGKDKILGATIVGEHAGEWIVEYTSAMRHGLGLKKLMRTIHIYPTLGDANKLAAGQWQRAHAPDKLLPWVERYHAWRRG